MELFALGFVVVFWIVPIFVAANMWERKGGNKWSGAAMGLIIGWIGVLIAAIASPGGTAKPSKQQMATSRECPHCKSLIRREATVCPHCQRESTPWILHEGRWWTKDSEGKDYYLDGVTGRFVEHQPQLPSSGEPSQAP